METCKESFFQTPFFITLLPILASVLTWLFKAWWDSKKPNTHDEDRFKDIKNILAQNKDSLLLLKNVDCLAGIDYEAVKFLHTLLYTFNNPVFFFSDKKITPAYNKLKETTTELQRYLAKEFLYQNGRLKLNLDKEAAIYDMEIQKRIETIGTKGNNLLDSFITSLAEFVQVSERRFKRKI